MPINKWSAVMNHLHADVDIDVEIVFPSLAEDLGFPKSYLLLCIFISGFAPSL